MRYEGFLGPGAIIQICLTPPYGDIGDLMSALELKEGEDWKKYETNLGLLNKVLLWDRDDNTITIRLLSSYGKGGIIDLPLRAVLSMRMLEDPTGLGVGDKVDVVVAKSVDYGDGAKKKLTGEVILNADGGITLMVHVLSDGKDYVIEIPKSNVEIIIKRQTVSTP
jgi:hypothetical protein